MAQRDALSNARLSAAASAPPTEPPSLQQLQAQVAVQHRQQDSTLDAMSAALDRLKTMGTAISDELDAQGHILDHTAFEVDHATAQTIAATRTTDRFIAAARDRCCCGLCGPGAMLIVALVVIIAVLVLILLN